EQQSTFGRSFENDFVTAPQPTQLHNITAVAAGGRGNGDPRGNASAPDAPGPSGPLHPLGQGSYGAYGVLLLAGLVLAVGVVGNMAVMCIVWNNYYMRSAWNYLLASMAAGTSWSCRCRWESPPSRSAPWAWTASTPPPPRPCPTSGEWELPRRDAEAAAGVASRSAALQPGALPVAAEPERVPVHGAAGGLLHHHARLLAEPPPARLTALAAAEVPP
ncbi:unnamed protein product, partial [Tetraodon nigroviridis]